MGPEHKSKHTIVLVDDETSILNALKRTLRPLGHRVQTAPSAPEGLALLKELPASPALIISDQRMPGMTGTQFLEAAKTLFPEAIRFMLSGYADLASVIDSVNRGEIHRFLTKPWDDKHLIQEVMGGVRQFELTTRNRKLLAHIQKQNKQLYDFGKEMERLVKERTKTLEGYLIRTLKSLGELADQGESQEAKSHGQRVAALSRDLATALNLPEASLVQIEVAGLLHDLGKIGLPKEESPESRKLYETHPEAGARVLENLPPFSEAAEAIRHHHERWDGSGFPLGLQGNAIPLSAQIVGLADTFDRIRRGDHKRAFPLPGLFRKENRPLAHEEAVAALASHAPHFSNQLIEALKKTKGTPSPLPVHEEASPERPIAVAHLEAGMVISRPLFTPSKRLIVPAGTPLTHELVEKLTRLARNKKVPETAHVIQNHGDSAQPPGTPST